MQHPASASLSLVASAFFALAHLAAPRVTWSAEAHSPPGNAPHWAFQPPHLEPGAPRSIDGHLEAAWRGKGLHPHRDAEPLIWLRRVHLDLTGLPPTAEEQTRFEKAFATAPEQARAAVVDKLLASPHHGERWGRHWMDVWRYSDWYGLGAQLRYSQKHIWHWRDWIIESLNHNKSYERMILEMLAGDELAPTDSDVLRATGFLARNYYLFNRTTWLDDVVEHTGKAFLGLTLNCVKCHEHKYDPFKHEEYYAFRAIFEPYHVRLDAVPGQPDLEKDGLPRVYDLHVDLPTYLHLKGDEKNPDKTKAILPGVPAVLAFAPLEIQPVNLPTQASHPETQAFILADHLAAARREADLAAEAIKKAGAKSAEVHVAECKLRVAETRRTAIEKQTVEANLAHEVAKAELAVAEAKGEKIKTAQAALKKARDAQAKGEGKPYRLTASLKALEGPDETEATRYNPFPTASTGRRLALARWIADKRNPLTARVMVNHLWLRHFGQPLVANVMDFGRQSKAPPLQPLLDWLAIEFMESGWDMKHMHRLMVLSHAYARSSSNAGAAGVNRSADPENIYYWRMNPVRMDAQSVRDSLLHLSGRLDPRLGGPTVDPKAEDKVFRRSLYFNHTRDEGNPFLEMFDNANVLDCYRRAESIVPQQALALMNARTALTSADAISHRFDGTDDAAFIRGTFRLLLGTAPTAEEASTCAGALKEMGAAGRAALVHTLLNHHDFITIR